MKNTNKILSITVLAFIIFWICRSFYKSYQFKSGYKITVGQVNAISKPGWKSSGDYVVRYEYSVSGIKYIGNNNYNFCDGASTDKLSLILINKLFPVAYSVKDANQCGIIITQKDAAIFNYTIADSLLLYDSLLTCK